MEGAGLHSAVQGLLGKRGGIEQTGARRGQVASGRDRPPLNGIGDPAYYKRSTSKFTIARPSINLGQAGDLVVPIRG